MFTQDVGSIYVEWGSYNICTCPLSVYLQSYVQGGGGIWRESRARTSSNGFGSLCCTRAPLSFGGIWVDTLHLLVASGKLEN